MKTPVAAAKHRVVLRNKSRDIT